MATALERCCSDKSRRGDPRGLKRGGVLKAEEWKEERKARRRGSSSALRLGKEVKKADTDLERAVEQHPREVLIVLMEEMRREPRF